MTTHYFNEIDKIDPNKLNELEKNCELDGNFISDNYNSFSAEEFAELLNVPINIIEMRAQYAGHVLYYSDHNRCSVCKKFIPVGESTCCNTTTDYKESKKVMSMDWEKCNKAYISSKRRYDKGDRESFYCPLCLVPFPLYKFESHAKSEHGREFMELVRRTNIKKGDTIFKPYDGKNPNQEEYNKMMEVHDSESVKKELLGDSYIEEGIEVMALPISSKSSLPEILEVLGSVGNGKLKTKFLQFLKSKGMAMDLTPDDRKSELDNLFKTSSDSDYGHLKDILNSEKSKEDFNKFMNESNDAPEVMSKSYLRTKFTEYILKVVVPQINKLVDKGIKVNGGNESMKEAIEEIGLSNEEIYIQNMSSEAIERHKKLITSVYYRGRRLRDKCETKLEEYRHCPICSVPLNVAGPLQSLSKHLYEYHYTHILGNLFEEHTERFINMLEPYNGEMLGVKEHLEKYPHKYIGDVEELFKEKLGSSGEICRTDTAWNESGDLFTMEELDKLSVKLGYTSLKQLYHNYKQNCKANAGKESGTVYECPYCLVPVATKGVRIHASRHGKVLEDFIAKHGVDVIMEKYDGTFLSEEEFLSRLAKHTTPKETTKFVIADRIKQAREDKKMELAKEREEAINIKAVDLGSREKPANLLYEDDDALCAEFGYPNTHNLCMNLSNNQRSADKRAKSGEVSYLCPICLIPIAAGGLKSHSNRHGERLTRIMDSDNILEFLEKYSGVRKTTADMILALGHQPPIDEILEELEDKVLTKLVETEEQELESFEASEPAMSLELEPAEVTDFEPVWISTQKRVEVPQKNVEVPINKDVNYNPEMSFLELIETRAVKIVSLMEDKQNEIDEALLVYEQLLSEKEKLRLERQHIEGIIALHAKDV